jgi:hypothetical protein
VGERHSSIVMPATLTRSCSSSLQSSR